MKLQTSWAGGTIIAAAFIIAGFAAVLAVDLPGHLSFDSIGQLLQGRTGVFNTWHPPVMAWLLGLGDAVVPGAGLFVLFDAVLCFGAMLSLLALRRSGPGWPAACVAALCVLTPQFLLYQGIVWKDVLFADASVAGFVCLAHVAQVWPNLKLRIALAGLGFGLLCLAALTRQNGIVILPFGVVAFGWMAWRESSRLRDGAIAAGSALILSVALIGAATWILDAHSDGEPAQAEQLTLLQVYDLAAAVAAKPDIALDRLSEDEPAFETMLRTTGARLYTPVRNDPMMDAPEVGQAIRDADDAVIAAQWRDLIVQHSWLYLKIRARDFWWVFATPDVAASRPVFVGVEGPADELGKLGIAPRRDGRDLALDRYAKGFLGTPVFSHLTFTVIALAAIVLLLRRRRTADIAIACMLLAAFSFSASFFVISISCDYRYLYVLDLSAMMALFYLSLDAGTLLKETP